MSKKMIRRLIAVIPALLLQLLEIFVVLHWLTPYAPLIQLLLTFFGFIYVLFIIGNRNEPTYKTLWLLVILGMPLVGALLYLFFGNKRTARPIARKLNKGKLLPPAPDDGPGSAIEELRREAPRLAQTFGYVRAKTGYGVARCGETAYYPLGEDMFEAMLDDLRGARQYIFAEYFIVERGRMWDEISEILTGKAAAGVDVRFMYDDLGSFSTFSEENIKWLEARGVKCVRFNPLVFVKGTLNYRDHRKMLIIDGRVAYSGGINLADEYINAIVKYGHWKDVGFRLTGEPVYSYIRMFAEFWNAFSREPIPMRLLTATRGAQTPETARNGYALSYCDSPLNADAVSNNLFIELLGQATRTAWFYTPYLLLGDNLQAAFVRAAQRGVDVRIFMPGIPDKPLVYRMSRSYYRPLLEAGVRIFEYTPGFLHAKACLIDDVTGTVGTVNLDFRSLFLHFENNTLFHRAPLLADLKADFEATQKLCRERTLANIDRGFAGWLLDGVLRVFAPLC